MSARKLTAEQAQAIRAARAADRCRYTLAALAAEYGVAEHTIRRICAAERYVSVEPEREAALPLNPKARRLTWAQACEIRRLREVNRFRYTHKALAALFGTNRWVVRDILSGALYVSPHEVIQRVMRSTPEQRQKWREQGRARYATAKERRAAWTAMQRERNEAAQDARS